VEGRDLEGQNCIQAHEKQHGSVDRLLRYYGWYSNASRGKRRKRGVRVPVEGEVQDAPQPDSDAEPFPRQRRRSWAQLLKKIY